MKTTMLKKLTVLLLLMASTIVMGLAEDREVILNKDQLIRVEEDPTIPNRMPSRPIQCVIGDDGIWIQGYDVEEILTYEAYDLDGACLLATEDPQEFCSFIISCHLSCEIRLIMSDFMLRGYIDYDI